MNQLSGHIWNAALLIVSVSVALAAEHVTASSPRSAASSDAAASDIGDFVLPARMDSALPRFRMTVTVDPFGRQLPSADDFAVASGPGVPTVSSRVTRRRLTAILIADERRVAVIDDAAVGVGDRLRDGSRVASIQQDRVFVVEKNGQWRTLTLTDRGQ